MAAWRWRKLLLKKVATMRLQKPEVVLCCRRESKRLAMMKRQGAEPRCSGLGDEGRRAAIRRDEMNATTKVSMRRQMSKRVGPASSLVRGWAANLLPSKHPSLRTSGSWSGSQKSPDRKAAKTSGQSPPVGSRDWERRQPCRASHAATLPPLPPSLIRQPISHWAASWTPFPPLFTWSGVPSRHISTSRTTIYGRYAFQVTSIRIPALAPLAPVWFPQVAKPASLQDCPPHFMDD